MTDSPLSLYLTGVRVLLVEDSPDIQLMLSRFLRAEGAHVDVADDGMQALDRTRDSDYDIVLMDLKMPKLDGYLTASVLRERGFKSPILALTAHAMNEVKEKCLKSGFNDRLTKPIEREKLIHEVATFTKRVPGGN